MATNAIIENMIMAKKKDNEINNHKKRQFQDKSKFLKKNVNKDKDDEMEI